MAKKNFFTVLYMGILAFICVFTFFKINERDLILQLDNHNLTAETYQINLKQNEKLSEITTALNKNSAINNVQVHFQSKKDKNLTYFYGKGDFPVPPMISGSFFSREDFKSIVPVAVVGKNLSKQLYKPKDQSYLHFENYYIPVLGIMGSKSPSKLDNQIFISGGYQIMQNLNSNDFVIKIDGRKNFNPQILKKIFNATSVERVQKKNTFIQSGSWISNHVLQLISLIFVIFASLGGIFLWQAASSKEYQEELFISHDFKRLIFEQWRSYTIYMGIGMILGTLVGTIIFTLSTYAEMIPFLVLLFIVNSLVFYILIRFKIKKIITDFK